jgi:hypothetical protein
MTERTGFRRDGGQSRAWAAGLWAKVLGFDAALLKRLLSDESVPQDIRDKLAALQRVTAAYPQLWVKKHSGEEA